MIVDETGPFVLVPAHLTRQVAFSIKSAIDEARQMGVRPSYELILLLDELQAIAGLGSPKGVPQAERTADSGNEPEDSGESLDDSGMYSTSETARLLRMSRRQVRYLAASEAFPGAQKVGDTWAFPSAAVYAEAIRRGISLDEERRQRDVG